MIIWDKKWGDKSITWILLISFKFQEMYKYLKKTLSNYLEKIINLMRWWWWRLIAQFHSLAIFAKGCDGVGLSVMPAMLLVAMTVRHRQITCIRSPFVIALEWWRIISLSCSASTAFLVLSCLHRRLHRSALRHTIRSGRDRKPRSNCTTCNSIFFSAFIFYFNSFAVNTTNKYVTTRHAQLKNYYPWIIFFHVWPGWPTVWVLYTYIYINSIFVH